jgi:hypothetical protein
MRVIWRSQALTIASSVLLVLHLQYEAFCKFTPTVASCAATPATADVEETMPTFELSLKELFIPKPLATRRVLPFTARPTTFPSFSLVLEASDRESSGAVRGFAGGILGGLFVNLWQARRMIIEHTGFEVFAVC